MKHALALVVLLAASVVAAEAEDFTFTVPVRLTNLESVVTGGRVFCVVGNNDLATTGYTIYSSAMIGSGSTTFVVDPATGSVSQNVVVKFNADAGKSAAQATRYRCQMSLQRGQSTVVGDTEFNAVTKPSPRTLQVGGTLPQ